MITAGVLLGALLLTQGQDPDAPSAELKARRAAVTVGKPEDSTEALAVQTEAVLDSQWTRLGIPGNTVLQDPAWTSDGKTLFILEKGGVLHRIQVPSFKEERRIVLGADGLWLRRSSAGLVVVMRELEELWLLDEGRLTIKHRIPVPRCAWVAASPASSLAFSPSGQDLFMVDLSAGKVAKKLSGGKLWTDSMAKVRKHKESIPGLNFGQLTLSPDGKYLFCVNVFCPNRLSVKGQALELEETGAPCTGENLNNRVVFSPDSSRVAFLGGGPSRLIEGWPKVQAGTPLSFKVTDLQSPEASFAIPAAVTFAWDKSGDKIYAGDRSAALTVWNPKGLKEVEYKLAAPGVTPLQFIAHPDGRKLLAVMSDGVYWVVLPSTFTPNVKKDDPAAGGLGKPVSLGTSLLGPRKQIPGAAVTELNGPGPFADALWSEDGKSLFAMEDPTGKLHKWSVPEFRDELMLPVGSRSMGLALCKDGLLFSVPALEEVWLVDPATLAVKRKIQVPGTTGVVSAPGLSIPFALSNGDLVALDLKKGALLKKSIAIFLGRQYEGGIYKHSSGHTLMQFNQPKATPDGKYLFCQSDQTLHRFLIQGESLIYEEAGAPVAVGPYFHISHDSRYVMVPSQSLQLSVVNHAPLKAQGAYVYKVIDLSSPVQVLQPEGDIRSMGLDRTNRAIYFLSNQGRPNPFTVFNSHEEKVRALEFSNPPMMSGDRLLVHPSGGKVLVTGGSRHYWIEVDKP